MERRLASIPIVLMLAMTVISISAMALGKTGTNRVQTSCDTIESQFGGSWDTEYAPWPDRINQKNESNLRDKSGQIILVEWCHNSATDQYMVMNLTERRTQ